MILHRIIDDRGLCYRDLDTGDEVFRVPVERARTMPFGDEAILLRTLLGADEALAATYVDEEHFATTDGVTRPRRAEGLVAFTAWMQTGGQTEGPQRQRHAAWGEERGGRRE